MKHKGTLIKAGQPGKNGTIISAAAMKTMADHLRSGAPPFELVHGGAQSIPSTDLKFGIRGRARTVMGSNGTRVVTEILSIDSIDIIRGEDDATAEKE
jgi:hypothetical protein